VRSASVLCVAAKNEVVTRDAGTSSEPHPLYETNAMTYVDNTRVRLNEYFPHGGDNGNNSGHSKRGMVPPEKIECRVNTETEKASPHFRSVDIVGQRFISRSVDGGKDCFELSFVSLKISYNSLVNSSILRCWEAVVPIAGSFMKMRLSLSAAIRNTYIFAVPINGVSHMSDRGCA